MADPILFQGMCVVCFHELHPRAKCAGGYDPTPEGDVWAACPCDESTDYETAGRRIVRITMASDVSPSRAHGGIE